MQVCPVLALDQSLAAYLAAVPPPGPLGRSLDVAASLVFAGLLQEIDQTILPRRLRFTGTSGAGLSLDVVNRHVLAVAGLSPADDGPLPRSFGQASEPDIAGLRLLLARFATENPRLWVRADRLAAPCEPGATGISTAALRGTVAPVPVSVGPAGLIDRFIRLIGPKVLAMVRSEGGILSVDGTDPDLLARLRGMMAMLDTTPRTDAPPDQLFLLGGDATGPAVLLCIAQSAHLLAAFDSAHMLQCAADWLACQNHPA